MAAPHEPSEPPSEPAGEQPALTRRERAVLLAIAAGRCQISAGAGASLVIDGLACCDQLVGPRLIRAGLIEPVGRGAKPAVAELTATGKAALSAA